MAALATAGSVGEVAQEMTHRLVKSTNVYSIAHEGDKMEARFKCQKCNGEGKDGEGKHCEYCLGAGRSETYQYEGVDAATFAKVSESASVGSAVHLLIKGKFKTTKL